jgi:phosphohistidine phosphatase
VKRLLLLRHAKAVPGGAKIDDHGRALAERGRSDAPKMGRYMRKHEFVPQLVLCSTSKRTAETAELAFAELKDEQPRLEFLEALYLAEPEGILSVLRSRAGDVGSVCVVGHNPGLEACATVLAREPITRKEKDSFDAIEEKFPTGALAVLDFEIRRWRDLVTRTGKLAAFVRPRDL